MLMLVYADVDLDEFFVVCYSNGRPFQKRISLIENLE